MLTAILAFFIDTVIGDPNSRWHPVVLMGKLISGLERLFYRAEDSDGKKYAMGAMLVLITLLVTYEAAAAIMMLSYHIPWEWGTTVVGALLLAFTISAAIAGAAGVLYAHNLASLAATPKSFGYNMSITILVFVVLGGIGNIRGSIIAAVVLTLLPELLRGLSNYRMLIYAIVLIVMMIVTSAPKAIALREQLMERFGKRAAKEAN